MNLIFLIIIINLLIIFLIYKFIFKNFTNAYKILFNLKENFKFKKYQHMFYYNENFKFKIIFQNKTYLRVNNYIFKHTKFNFTGSKKEKNTKKIILLIYANVSNYFTYKLGNVYFNRKLRKQSINLVKINLKGKNIKVEDSKNNIILKKFNINVPQKKLVLILMLDGMNSFLSNDLNYSSQFFGKKNKINSLWSNAPWTLPTFGNLITGLYTSNHQNYMARSYYSKSNSHNSQIKSEITMFEFFKNLGFVTGCYSPYPRINPTYGFDRGVDFLKYCENQTADEINDNIISQIEFCKEKNNFIFAHFLDAHHLVKNHKRVADFIFTPDDNQDYRKQDSVIKIKNQNLDTNKSKLNSFLKEKNFSEEKDIINQMKLTDFRLNNLYKYISTKKFDDFSIILMGDHGTRFSGKNKNGNVLNSNHQNVGLFIKDKKNNFKDKSKKLISTIDIFPSLANRYGTKKEILKISKLDGINSIFSKKKIESLIAENIYDDDYEILINIKNHYLYSKYKIKDFDQKISQFYDLKENIISSSKIDSKKYELLNREKKHIKKINLKTNP